MANEKVGRNDPCPCGSGKKYKKCCLAADEARPKVTPLPPGIPTLGELARRFDGGAGVLAPYTVLRFAEGDVPQSQFEGDPSKGHERAWTRAALAALDDDALLAGLAVRGVMTSRAAFLEAARTRWSAWALSDEWRRSVARLAPLEDDYLGIAACELWRRWLPERPSVEMLDDRMQEGYAVTRRAQPLEALAAWWPLWETIRARIEPGIRQVDDTLRVFRGTEHLGNWLHDLLDVLRHAARITPDWAERALAFIAAVEAQFPGEFDEELDDAERAHFHFQAGRRAEGEALLRAAIARDPLERGLAELLADCLASPATGEATAADLEAAIAVLEEALARPAAEDDDTDLAGMLEDIRAELAERHGR